MKSMQWCVLPSGVQQVEPPPQKVLISARLADSQTCAVEKPLLLVVTDSAKGPTAVLQRSAPTCPLKSPSNPNAGAPWDSMYDF